MVAAGKIDLNNTAQGEIARFLRDQGQADEDAQASAQIIIDLRKSKTGVIPIFPPWKKPGSSTGS